MKTELCVFEKMKTWYLKLFRIKIYYIWDLRVSQTTICKSHMRLMWANSWKWGMLTTSLGLSEEQLKYMEKNFQATDESILKHL